MLLSECLLGKNLNIHAKSEKHRPPRNIIGILIHLLKDNEAYNQNQKQAILISPQGSKYEHYSLLLCDTPQYGRWAPLFQNLLAPPWRVERQRQQVPT